MSVVIVPAIAGEPDINAIVPDQTGQAGNDLQTDGSTVSWQPGGGAGANTSLSNLTSPTSVNQPLTRGVHAINISSALLTRSGFTTLNWHSGLLIDGSVANSADWINRLLIANDGSTQQMDWSTPSSILLPSGGSAPISVLFQDNGQSNTVGFKAPTSITTPVTWVLPPGDGTSKQGIVTDGAGNLSFGTAGAAGASGDIQFNSAGVLGNDTGNLFWDSTNHRLGIGTAVPATTVHVVTAGASGVDHGIIQENNSANGTGPNVRLRKSRGTFASPTAVLSADSLGAFNFYGYGSSYLATADASISCQAAQNFSGSAHGTNLTFRGTPLNGTAQINRFALNNDGGIVFFSSTAVTSLTHYMTTGGASYAINWPASQGATTTNLQNDGAGNLTWAAANVTPSGATGSRPGSPVVGQVYFDTSLAAGAGKPIWYNGTNWVDATGTIV